VLLLNGTLTNSGPAGVAVLQVCFSQSAPTKWVCYAAQLAAFAKVPQGADAAATPFSVALRVRDMEAWDEEAWSYVVYNKGNYTTTRWRVSRRVHGCTRANVAAGRAGRERRRRPRARRGRRGRRHARRGPAP
jgi:hypothetical protein